MRRLKRPAPHHPAVKAGGGESLVILAAPFWPSPWNTPIGADARRKAEEGQDEEAVLR
jgi:hypothetical protein